MAFTLILIFFYLNDLHKDKAKEKYIFFFMESNVGWNLTFSVKYFILSKTYKKFVVT